MRSRMSEGMGAGGRASDQALAHLRREHVDERDGHDEQDQHEARLAVLEAADHVPQHRADAARAHDADDRRPSARSTRSDTACTTPTAARPAGSRRTGSR